MNDVEPICHLIYPVEYHFTLGRFIGTDIDALKKWGEQSIFFIKDQESFLREEDQFKIIINEANRQPVSHGGGFYLQPIAQISQKLIEINERLSALLLKDHIQPARKGPYHPHVSLTVPITRTAVDSEEEEKILDALNRKIKLMKGDSPGCLILHPVAIKTLLKYRNERGRQKKELWEVRQKF